MSDDLFTDPAKSDSIEYQPLRGSLLLFNVLSYEEHVPTAYTQPGERSPAVRANVVVLDGQLAGKTYDDALVFPKMLIGQLRSRVGKMVLGRLGQGEAKQGQTPPWRLDAATDADKATARGFLGRGSGQAPPPPAPSQGFGGPTQQQPLTGVAQSEPPF